MARLFSRPNILRSRIINSNVTTVDFRRPLCPWPDAITFGVFLHVKFLREIQLGHKIEAMTVSTFTGRWIKLALEIELNGRHRRSVTVS